MMNYDFAVRKHGELVTLERSVALPDLSAVWSRVGDFAQKLDEPGSLILVTNGAGEVVILIGVATARVTLEIAPSPQLSRTIHTLTHGPKSGVHFTRTTNFVN